MPPLSLLAVTESLFFLAEVALSSPYDILPCIYVYEVVVALSSSYKLLAISGT